MPPKYTINEVKGKREKAKNPVTFDCLTNHYMKILSLYVLAENVLCNLGQVL